MTPMTIHGNRHMVAQYSNLSHDYPMIIPWLSQKILSQILDILKKEIPAFFWFKSHGNHHIFWLLVDLPLWKIWVRQLGWWNSQLFMESHKIPWFQTTNQKMIIKKWGLWMSLAGIGPFFGWLKGSKFTSPPHAAGTSRAPRSPRPETTAEISPGRDLQNHGWTMVL